MAIEDIEQLIGRVALRDRAAFVDELVSTYQVTAGRPGLFRFMQMRAELRP